LANLLLARAQFVGTYDDLARAEQLASTLLANGAENDAAARLLAARVKGGLHDFAAAAKHRLAANPAAPADALTSVATGDNLEGAHALATTAARDQPSLQSVSALASVEAALGHYELADTLYQDSLESYRDVSPLPVAWVQFQRGVMWSEMAAQPERALPLYQDAVRRLPGYVTANVHLAELEYQRGEHSQATRRLEDLVANATLQDPEPLGLLGEWLQSGDAQRSTELIRNASARYEQLLARFPLAFLDHGAEFFAGPGRDPSRALRLALRNLENRRTPRAFQVAIQSATAAGDSAKACQLSAQATRERRVNPTLGETLQTLSCSN
jgi:hypothetical protein